MPTPPSELVFKLDYLREFGPVPDWATLVRWSSEGRAPTLIRFNARTVAFRRAELLPFLVEGKAA